ncbi:reverse transcriptase domain-containing protein [Tanacetum coccineum]
MRDQDQSKAVTMINGVLYRKSFLEPWLRCVGLMQAEYVVKEIYEGSYSMYSGPRSVVAKAIRSGYYWPTMHKGARNIIRACNDCQTYRPVPRNLQQKLTPITSLWSFYKWRIDISGPFSEAQGKVKLLMVAVDYFTKWIKAKPVAKITRNQVKKFVWDNIVCRFGLLGEIIFDNGKQFRDNPFKDWCEKLNIKQRFASVKHLQSNGQVERVNCSLGEGIKARLGEDNRNWVEEVTHVLWAHRTMIKTSNEDTPFSITYGTEAVIPVEIGMPSIRCAEVNQAENNEGLLLNLDILEERREKTAETLSIVETKQVTPGKAESWAQSGKGHMRWWKHSGRERTNQEHKRRWLRFGHCVLLLRFGHRVWLLKVAFCLLANLTAFCLKTSLRFASRPHCILLQDIHCVLLEDLTAFCLKTSLRFVSRPHCVLLQAITAFYFNITAFCSRPPLRFA